MLEVLHRKIIVTPIGMMTAISSEKGLCALEFGSVERDEKVEARLKRWFPDLELTDSETEALDLTEQWLDNYFDKRFDRLTYPPMDIRGSAFEKAVWEVLRAIPLGTGYTYLEVATELGNPRATRAVGGACGRNMLGIIIPCHRVVGANGNLTGYAGGINNKQWLLFHEGWSRNPLRTPRKKSLTLASL